jgi:glycine cleavage system H lipoate-binding protein
MACPFLREAHVRSCHAAAVRKMIVGTGAASNERCSSPEFRVCDTARQRVPESEPADRCPFLHDTLVRYCEAAPVPRFIPYSDPGGRCGTDGYRYCEAWLRMSRGGVPQRTSEALIERLHVPPGLLYSPNHMWLDVDAGSTCYIGIDGLLADVLGRVERISFVTLHGVHRPTAVVTARGVDWALVFPRRLLITGANVYMRHAPERLTADPYGAGWLFEGSEVPADGGPGLRDGLIEGSEAAAWMAREAERITEFIHELPGAVQNDGGTLACGFAEHLEREDVLCLLNEFFAPHLASMRTF